MTREPNQWFEVAFNHFCNEFGKEEEILSRPREGNKEEIKKQWHPRKRLKLLKQRTQDIMIRAAFTIKPIGAWWNEEFIYSLFGDLRGIWSNLYLF